MTLGKQLTFDLLQNTGLLVGTAQDRAVTKGPAMVALDGRFVDEPAARKTASLGNLIAADFACWAAAHGLARAWTVDEIWFLASEDYAPAVGLVMPPRRVFLGLLQRVAGVRVEYDRRQFGRDGRVKGKTTIYTLPMAAEAESAQAA